MTIRAAVCLCALSAGIAFGAENWPNWRGPALDGTSDSTGLPLTWSATQNVRWKTPLPSWSAATPCIWGDRIFVMSGSPAVAGEQAATEKGGSGRVAREGRGVLLLCLSRLDGSVRWERELDQGNAHYNKQNMASPSPVTDGKHVWALTGTGVLAAYDFEGQLAWKREIQKDYGEFGLDFGYASSPLFLDGKVIVQVLHSLDKVNRSYLLAVDAGTGKNAWKVDRPTDAVDESPDAYTTPTLLRGPAGVQLVIAGGDYITGHNPLNGQEIWRCGGLNENRDDRYRAVCSPVVVGDKVLMSVRSGPLVACRGGGQGTVTSTHLAWSSPTAPDVPTPVSDGRLVYVLHDPGMFSCLELADGKARYVKERLPSGPYSASPLLADGRVYLLAEKGRTTVVAAGPEFRVLAENELGDGHALSSIAVAGRELFIRTGKYLFCISQAAASRPAP